MLTWLGVSQTKLAMIVCTPAPCKALVIDGYAKVACKADVNDGIGDCEYALGNRDEAPDAAAPHKQMTI